MVHRYEWCSFCIPSSVFFFFVRTDMAIRVDKILLASVPFSPFCLSFLPYAGVFKPYGCLGIAGLTR